MRDTHTHTHTSSQAVKFAVSHLGHDLPEGRRWDWLACLSLLPGKSSVAYLGPHCRWQGDPLIAQQTVDAHFLTWQPWPHCRYVSQVIISDMTVKKKWHFQCSCWLAVDLGHCERDRVFTPASRRELSSFRYNCSCRHWCVLRGLYLSPLLLIVFSTKLFNPPILDSSWQFLPQTKMNGCTRPSMWTYIKCLNVVPNLSSGMFPFLPLCGGNSKHSKRPLLLRSRSHSVATEETTILFLLWSWEIKGRENLSSWFPSDWLGL